MWWIQHFTYNELSKNYIISSKLITFYEKLLKHWMILTLFFPFNTFMKINVKCFWKIIKKLVIKLFLMVNCERIKKFK